MALTVVPADVYAAETLEFGYVEMQESSEYGYAPYKYYDSEGNEIEFDGGSSGVSAYSLRRTVLPSAYDSRDNGSITSVKEQGISGNCWAFSTISALESDSIIKGIDDADFADYSEAHLAWFAGKSLSENEEDSTYGDGYSYDSPYAQGGNWKTATAALARWSGLAEDSEYPFSPNDLSAMGNYDESERYNTSAGVVIESAQELSDTTSVKQWIIDHGSVTAAVYYDESCYNSETASYYYTSSGSINHQITIVGWDDNYSASNFSSLPVSDGAWICKNSWTSAWGDNGYFYVSYEDASLTQFIGFSAQKEDYYKNYSYNGAEWYYYYNRTTATQIANVFTASGYETLTAVSTYTIAAGTDVKVSVYKGLSSNYSTPVKGTAVSELEATLGNAGYHTIYLDTEVELEPGEIFSVVMEFSHSSGKVYIPIEINQSSSVQYGCKDKQSFINLNSAFENWQDAQFYSMENVYIQAFTKCSHQIETKIDAPSCSEFGYSTAVCSQCGLVESKEAISFTAHEFGEWSEYAYDEASGEEVSTRVCESCGTTQRMSNNNSNVIGIEKLPKLLFEIFFEIFSKIFKIR